MASTGLTIGLIKALAKGGIDPSQLEEALAEYLEEHPEALQTDVQINGTSITSQGVANIPKSSSSSLGVAKVNSNSFGININGDGELYLNKASDTHVKEGSNQYRPLVPYNQSGIAFYGLAKAAGADMASVSGATVGTYTDAAKVAIQHMLGIDLPFRVIREMTLMEDKSSVTINTDDNGSPFSLKEVVIEWTLEICSGSGNGGIQVNSNSNHYIAINNNFNTSAKSTRFISIEIKGGRMFGYAAASTLTNDYTPQNITFNRAGFGYYEEDSITSLKFLSLNQIAIPTGSKIKIIGR